MHQQEIMQLLELLEIVAKLSSIVALMPILKNVDLVLFMKKRRKKKLEGHSWNAFGHKSILIRAANLEPMIVDKLHNLSGDSVIKYV